jgi:hypothetical protein
MAMHATNKKLQIVLFRISMTKVKWNNIHGLII